MMKNTEVVPDESDVPPNGSGAAAVLAAGVGCFVMGVLAVAADKIASVKSLLNFYKPTRPLSGVTTAAILLWLAVWGVLDWRWRKQDVPLAPINGVAFALLGAGLLLTFPPIADLF